MGLNLVKYPLHVAAVAAMAAVGLAGSAWAGADDGGSKAFYMSPGPGAYSGAPAAETAPQPYQQSAFPGQDSAATATMNSGAYESYTLQPTEPAQRVRHHVWKPRAGAE